MHTRHQSKSAKADLQAWKDGTLSFYCLDHRRLRPGDVLLESGSSSVSTLIRWADEGEFSHAMIYVGGGQIVEAVLRGTVFLSTRRIVTRRRGRWLHLRPRTALTATQEAAIALTVRSQALKPYAMVGVFGTKAKALQGVEGDRSLFCSQLFALAYDSIGIPVVPGSLAETVTPNMLLGDGSILAPVPGSPFAVMAVSTEEELKAALELENRDEAIQGTEVDQNRLIDQEAVKALASRFKSAGDFVDGHARPIANMSELLAHMKAMKPWPGREVSNLLDAMLRERGYFDLFDASLAKSHVPNWKMTISKLVSRPPSGDEVP